MAFFIHPEHGAMNASESEAPALEKQGWKLSTVDEWFRINGKPHLCKDAAPQVQQESDEESAESVAVKRKPGRPPKAK